MVIKKYTVGTAVRITAEMRDSDNNLTDVSSAVVTVYDPTETAKVTEAAMSKESTGVYYYVWQSSEDDAEGLYSPKVKSVASDGYISRKKIDLFELRSEVDS
jgi:hypothetical protein